MAEDKTMTVGFEAQSFYEQWVDDSGKEGINKSIVVPHHWGCGSHNKPICVLEFDLLSGAHAFKFHARPALRYDADHHIKVYHHENRPARVELVINEKGLDFLMLELTRIKEALLNKNQIV
jgi:hypothetical protein